jgi:CubicO group peptidase (beta-lactamase class C family)
MPEDEFSGVAAVRRDGVTVAERAGGMADRDLGLPVAPGTRFQIASVSKQFTAAAVLLLASRSRLALDDPVGRWLGGGPPGWESITVAHLLAHTSGLGHWPDYPGLDVYARIEAADELAFFQARPLLSAPGSRYRYSSPGYVLLAWIVERVTGQPYAGFLAGEVFGPLGLTSASAGDPPGGPGMARGYRAGEPLASADLATVSIGAGDLWCSVPDLLRWDEAIGGDELLPAAFREAMFTVHAPGSPGGEGGWSYGGYGYGWRIGTYRGHRARYHAGDNPGYLSLNAWLPDDRVTLAVLVNDEATDILAVADGLLRVAT